MASAKAGSRVGRTFITQLVALALVAVAFIFCREPAPPPEELSRLASRFSFQKLDIQNEKLFTGEIRWQHPVHPSLERIAAWISATGASVTLADLDGDGLPNDMCLADPRLAQLTIMPVPGTPERYVPFSLNPSPLAVDAETMLATGAVAGDFNEDGLMDVMVYYWGRTPIVHLRKASAANTALGADAFHPCELVVNDHGRPTQWYTHAATQADIDGDGHLDLVMGNFFRDNAGVLDVHGTGVAKVMQAGKSKALNGGGGKLFLWQSATRGDEPTVKFVDKSETIVSLCDNGWVLAVGAADLDNDMRPEIYFADDFGPDRLLHNRSTPGQPKFALAEGRRTLTTPKSCVLGHDSFKGMGVGFADMNHDGFLDIYVSNIADQYALQETHFVWLSNGDPRAFQQGIAPYTQGSEQLGMSRSGWGWDSKFADFDNDGEPEAVQATGFIKGTINRWPELQALGTSNDRIINDPRFWPKFTQGADVSGHNHNPFFVRGPEGVMVDIAAALGMSQPLNSRGIAIADVDGDGRLDYAVADQWEPSYFYHNDSASAGTFLGLHLLLPPAGDEASEFRVRPGHPGPDTPGRPAIGARATLLGAARPASSPQTAASADPRATNSATPPASQDRILFGEVDGGSGHAGRSSPDLHFGLGKMKADVPIDVELAWRDAHGELHNNTIRVTPGWHTVVLGSPAVKLTERAP